MDNLGDLFAAAREEKRIKEEEKKKMLEGLNLRALELALNEEKAKNEAKKKEEALKVEQLKYDVDIFKKYILGEEDVIPVKPPEPVVEHVEEIEEITEELTNEVDTSDWRDEYAPTEFESEDIIKAEPIKNEPLPDFVKQSMAALESTIAHEEKEELNESESEISQIRRELDRLRTILFETVGKVEVQGGGGEVNLQYLDDIVGIATNLNAFDGKFLKVDTSNSAQPFVFAGVSTTSTFTGTTGQVLMHNGSEYVGVHSVGLGTFFNNLHQGYYRYTTDYYTTGVANTVQSLPADTFVLIQPQVRTNKTDFMPLKMLTANNNDPWIGAGATIGTGQTEFSLAGTDAGSSVIVRIAAQFNPDIDNTNLDFSLNFTTNPTTQSFGTTHFSVIREQAVICNEGAEQNYISETLINFYVGNSLAGLTTTDAGSFNLSARASDEGEFEMLALTINVVT